MQLLSTLTRVIFLAHLLLSFSLFSTSEGADEPKDLYKILGVSKTATPKEIKRAYREQSLKHHPDRNKGNEEEATQRFQEIGEAYEILSDEDKRRTYDQFGYDGLKNNFHNSNFHFHDPFQMFEQFFGDDEFFSHFGHKKGQNNGGRGRRRGGHSIFDNFFEGFGDFGDFGAPGARGGAGGGGGSASSFSFSSFGGGAGGGAGFGSFSSMSEQTMFVNGKKIRKVTKQQNGKKIEETYENDKLIEQIVDGSKQALPKIDL